MTSAKSITWKRIRPGVYQSAQVTRGGVPLFEIENTGDRARPWDLCSVYRSRPGHHFTLAEAKRSARSQHSAPKCATIEHGGMVLATRTVSYLYRGQGLRIAERVCTPCAEAYARRPVLVDLTVLPLASW
jgi:hypothetical protein